MWRNEFGHEALPQMLASLQEQDYLILQVGSSKTIRGLNIEDHKIEGLEDDRVCVMLRSPLQSQFERRGLPVAFAESKAPCLNRNPKPERPRP